MKKFDIKAFAGVAMAIMTGLVATMTAISDKQKNEKIDELIDKVDKLTQEQ